jgi:hypothetical protein
MLKVTLNTNTSLPNHVRDKLYSVQSKESILRNIWILGFLFVFTAIKVDIIDNSEMLLQAKHL